MIEQMWTTVWELKWLLLAVGIVVALMLLLARDYSGISIEERERDDQ